jgi:hypothetical protein
VSIYLCLFFHRRLYACCGHWQVCCVLLRYSNRSNKFHRKARCCCLFKLCCISKIPLCCCGVVFAGVLGVGGPAAAAGAGLLLDGAARLLSNGPAAMLTACLPVLLPHELSTHSMLTCCCLDVAFAGVLGVGGPAATAGAGLLLEGAAGPLKVRGVVMQSLRMLL